MARAIERRAAAKSTVMRPVEGSANYTQRRLAALISEEIKKCDVDDAADN